jgi:hypothetical protein
MDQCHVHIIVIEVAQEALKARFDLAITKRLQGAHQHSF